MDNQIVLLPHNEMAYNKLNKTLENNQMATINHATGTGKSFIMLKYIVKISYFCIALSYFIGIGLFTLSHT